MKTTRKSTIIEYLKNSEEGACIENEETGVIVEVTNMCGGKYLISEKNGEIIRQTDDAITAYKYLIK